MNIKNDDNIMVSVYCLAYNHSDYIKNALEGFVNQKTNFRYEVIVHDDASTDNTPNIIREYEQKYPEIIKGIYQKENQYSQGIQIFYKHILPRLQGKYIAMCEGDDYWSNENKLQMQFDALEKHPECDMCAHRAEWFNCLNESTVRVFPEIYEEKILTVEEVIYGEGDFLPTASLFYRKNIRNNPMKFQRVWGIDYSLQIRGALRGGVVFLPHTMSVYRWNTKGSWTSRNENIESMVKLNTKRKQMLEELNAETGWCYDEVIKKRIKKNEFLLLLLERNYRKALNSEYRVFVNEFKFSGRIKLFLKAYFPKLSYLYFKIRKTA